MCVFVCVWPRCTTPATPASQIGAIAEIRVNPYIDLSIYLFPSICRSICTRRVDPHCVSSLSIYICVCMYVCIHMCVCVIVWEGGGVEGECKALSIYRYTIYVFLSIYRSIYISEELTLPVSPLHNSSRRK